MLGKLPAFLVGSKFSTGEEGWRGQRHRDNPNPHLGSPRVMPPGHDTDLHQPGGLGTLAAATWLAPVGEVTTAGPGLPFFFFFFPPKSLRVLGIQIYRHLLNAEAWEEEMKVEIHGPTGEGRWVGFFCLGNLYLLSCIWLWRAQLPRFSPTGSSGSSETPTPLSQHLHAGAALGSALLSLPSKRISRNNKTLPAATFLEKKRMQIKNAQLKRKKKNPTLPIRKTKPKKVWRRVPLASLQSHLQS